MSLSSYKGPALQKEKHYFSSDQKPHICNQSHTFSYHFAYGGWGGRIALWSSKV